MSKVLNSEQLGIELGIAARTVRNWAHGGILERLPGGGYDLATCWEAEQAEPNVALLRLAAGDEGIPSSTQANFAFAQLQRMRVEREKLALARDCTELVPREDAVAAVKGGERAAGWLAEPEQLALEVAPLAAGIGTVNAERIFLRSAEVNFPTWRASVIRCWRERGLWVWAAGRGGAVVVPAAAA
jgi:hypothetical protein